MLLTTGQAARHGYLQLRNTTIADLTGRAPRTIQEVFEGATGNGHQS